MIKIIYLKFSIKMWTIIISKEGIGRAGREWGGRRLESYYYETVCKYSKKKLLNSFRKGILVCVWKEVRLTHLGKNKRKYQILKGLKYMIRYKWATENEGQP